MFQRFNVHTEIKLILILILYFWAFFSKNGDVGRIFLQVCGGEGPRPSRKCSGGDVGQQILIELSLVAISRFVARIPPSASAFITKNLWGQGAFSLLLRVFLGPLADEAEETSLTTEPPVGVKDTGSNRVII